MPQTPGQDTFQPFFSGKTIHHANISAALAKLLFEFSFWVSFGLCSKILHVILPRLIQTISGLVGWGLGLELRVA